LGQHANRSPTATTSVIETADFCPQVLAKLLLSFKFSADFQIEIYAHSMAAKQRPAVQ